MMSHLDPHLGPAWETGWKCRSLNGLWRLFLKPLLLLIQVCSATVLTSGAAQAAPSTDEWRVFAYPQHQKVGSLHPLSTSCPLQMALEAAPPYALYLDDQPVHVDPLCGGEVQLEDASIHHLSPSSSYTWEPTGFLERASRRLSPAQSKSGPYAATSAEAAADHAKHMPPQRAVPLFVPSEDALRLLARAQSVTPVSPVVGLSAAEKGIWLATPEGAFWLNDLGESRQAHLSGVQAPSGALEHVWQTGDRLWTLKGAQLCLRVYTSSSDQQTQSLYCQSLQHAPDGISQVVPLSPSCTLAVTRAGTLLQLSLSRSRWEERPVAGELGEGWQTLSHSGANPISLWGIQREQLVGIELQPPSDDEGGCPTLAPSPVARLSLGVFEHSSVLSRWWIAPQRNPDESLELWIGHGATLKRVSWQPQRRVLSVQKSWLLPGELVGMAAPPAAQEGIASVMVATTSSATTSASVQTSARVDRADPSARRSFWYNIQQDAEPRAFPQEGSSFSGSIRVLLWSLSSADLFWGAGEDAVIRCRLSTHQCEEVETHRSLFHNVSLTALSATRSDRIWWGDSAGSLYRLETSINSLASVTRCQRPPVSFSERDREVSRIGCWPWDGAAIEALLERDEGLVTASAHGVCLYPLTEASGDECPDWTKGVPIYRWGRTGADEQQHERLLPDVLQLVPGRRGKELLLATHRGVYRAELDLSAAGVPAQPGLMLDGAPSRIVAEKWTPYRADGAETDLSTLPVTSLVGGPDAVWGVAGGQLFCNQGTRLERRCAHTWDAAVAPASVSSVQAVAGRIQGGLWFADAQRGLWRHDARERGAQGFRPVALTATFKTVEQLWEDEQQRVWIFGHNAQDLPVMSFYAEPWGLVGPFEAKHGLRPPLNPVNLNPRDEVSSDLDGRFQRGPMVIDAEGRLWGKEGMTRLQLVPSGNKPSLLGVLCGVCGVVVLIMFFPAWGGAVAARRLIHGLVLGGVILWVLVIWSLEPQGFSVLPWVWGVELMGLDPSSQDWVRFLLSLPAFALMWRVGEVWYRGRMHVRVSVQGEVASEPLSKPMDEASSEVVEKTDVSSPSTEPFSSEPAGTRSPERVAPEGLERVPSREPVLPERSPEPTNDNEGAGMELKGPAKELQEAIREKKAILVIGTGVSMETSGGASVASWLGLLKHGIAHCVEYGRADEQWADDMRNALKKLDTDALLMVAHQVSQKLGGEKDGLFAAWLGETVGKLEPKHPELIQTLRQMELPIMTTNYDGLIEEITRLKVLTNAKPVLMKKWLDREPDAGVFHLHGYWEEPATVVLDLFQYRDVVKDSQVQAQLQSIAITSSLIFVGCGGGLEDPNVGAFLEWMGGILSTSPRSHFVLVRALEVVPLKDRHRDVKCLRILSYGADYADLRPFLQRLSVPTA
ncbi:MAG: SIR2 family protein [Myxococcota bacterium]